MEYIVHICKKTDWQNALGAGRYHAASLDTEGFIHCSRPDQVLTVANIFYPGQADLVLLWIAPSKCAHELRWEPVEQDEYPHIYGPLNLDAVVRTTDFPPDPDGVFRSLPDPGSAA